MIRLLLIVSCLFIFTSQSFASSYVSNIQTEQYDSNGTKYMRVTFDVDTTGASGYLFAYKIPVNTGQSATSVTLAPADVQITGKTISFPIEGANAISKVEFRITNPNGDSTLVDSVTAGTTDPPPDTGGGGTTDPPPDTGGGGTTDPPPDSGGGTTDPPPDSGCVCCEEMKGIMNDLVQAAEDENYKLDDIKDVMDDLNDAVEEQGYKLDDIKNLLSDTNDKLDDVNNKLDSANDKLDTANDHLSNIEDQVTPHADYNIPQVDWQGESNKIQVPYTSQMGSVRDNNVYFSDPGEDEKVPSMPPQPVENYPVPIGEGLVRESPLTANPALSADIPLSITPSKERQEPLQRDSVRSVTPMERDPIPSTINLQRDPVKDQTNIYQRQEVPSK